MQIKHYIVTYNPTDDAGYREILSQEEHAISFDDIDELFDWMCVERGIYEYSSPEYQPRMWYSAEPYHDPNTRAVREETVQRGDDVTDDQWRALFDMMEEC